MKNKLVDLTDHFFMELERLGEDFESSDALRDEIARAGAIASIGREIISAGRLAVEAQKVATECAMTSSPRAPKLLGLDHLSGQEE